MTKADKINATEAAVDFSKDSALSIHNKVRIQTAHQPGGAELVSIISHHTYTTHLTDW